MSDAARVYAFDALASAVQSAPLAVPGVMITPQRPAAMLNVRGDPGHAGFLHETASVFGIELPTAANTARCGKGVRALWLGPDEWLVVYANEAVMSQNVMIVNGTMTDVSHGRAVLRIAGLDARAVLAKGCPLDLDVREFPADSCAQTAFGRIHVIVDHVGADVFDLYCSRSYARSFWHSIAQAAAEYGLNVSR